MELRSCRRISGEARDVKPSLPSGTTVGDGGVDESLFGSILGLLHGLNLRVGVFFLNIVAFFGVADLIGVPKEIREAPKRKGRFRSDSAPSKAHPFF